MLRIDIQRGHFLFRPAENVPPLDMVDGQEGRHGFPAIDDAGGHHGQLQRRREDIALADPDDECFTGMPRLTAFVAFPLLGGDQMPLV